MKRAITKCGPLALMLLWSCAPEAGEEVLDPAEPRALDLAASVPDACGGVDGSALLDVGHSDVVKRVVRSGDRVLSVGGHRWVLWDVAQHRQLARGEQATGSFSWQFATQLAGETVLASREPGGRSIDVRDARDGRVLTSVDIGPTYAKLALATDGSYVWRADGQTLRVLTREGRLLFERAGDYANANVLAAPDALYVASRPGGSGRIEIVSATDGTVGYGLRNSTQGVQWFADEPNLFVAQGQDRYVFDVYGTFFSVISGTGEVGGASGRVWSYEPGQTEDHLSVTRMDDDVQLAVLALPHTARDVVPGTGARTLALLDRRSFVALDANSIVQQLDLRAERPQLIRTALPGTVRSFDADARGAWVAGGERGVVHVGEPGATGSGSTLGCGDLQAAAISASGRVALATDDGSVRIYEGLDAPRLVSTIAAQTTDVALTGDGKRMVARGARTNLVDSDRNARDQSVRVFSTDDGKLVHQFPHAQGDQPAFMDFGLSAAGQLAQRLCKLGDSATGNRRECTIEVSDLSGVVAYRTQPVTWLYPGTPWDDDPPRFSPSGRRLAFTVPRPERGLGEAETVLYEDGHLLRTLPGRAYAWLDDAHLLMNGEKTRAVDLEGNRLAGSADVSVGGALGAVDAEHYFAGSSIYRLGDGAVAWSAAGTGAAIQAVAGDFAVVRAGDRVHVMRWR